MSKRVVDQPRPRLEYLVRPTSPQYHKWWAMCRQQNQPFIAVEYWQSKVCGCVKVDFDTCNWRLTTAGSQAVNVLLRSVMLSSHSRKAVTFPASDPPQLYETFSVFWANREDAEPLARMLAAIIAHEHEEVDERRYWLGKEQ